MIYEKIALYIKKLVFTDVIEGVCVVKHTSSVRCHLLFGYALINNI